MGVMACDREGRENVCCDIFIEGKWHVCNQCASEFILGQSDNSRRRADIAQCFAGFMETPKLIMSPNDVMTAEDFIYGGFMKKEREQQ